MDNKEYLPIGSVVRLKNATKEIMITGYLENQKDKTCDYCACLFPDGILSFNDVLHFNQEQIDEILFIGYKNEDFDKISEILSKEGVI